MEGDPLSFRMGRRRRGRKEGVATAKGGRGRKEDGFGFRGEGRGRGGKERKRGGGGGRGRREGGREEERGRMEGRVDAKKEKTDPIFHFSLSTISLSTVFTTPFFWCLPARHGSICTLCIQLIPCQCPIDTTIESDSVRSLRVAETLHLGCVGCVMHLGEGGGGAVYHMKTVFQSNSSRNLPIISRRARPRISPPPPPPPPPLFLPNLPPLFLSLSTYGEP